MGSGLHRIPVACREASNSSRHLGCHPQSLVSISRFLRMCGFYGFLSPSRICWSPNRGDVSGASPASAMASICPNLATATFFREHLAARNKGYPWKTGIVDDVPWVTDNNMAISDGYVGWSEGSICTLKIGRVACTQHGVGSKQTAIASHGSASIHGTKNAHVRMHATAKTWLL